MFNQHHSDNGVIFQCPTKTDWSLGKTIITFIHKQVSIISLTRLRLVIVVQWLLCTIMFNTIKLLLMRKCRPRVISLPPFISLAAGRRP